jgi:hypothetical protein
LREARDAVLRAVRALAETDPIRGASVHAVLAEAARDRVPEEAARRALAQLTEQADVYQTVDDDHYLPTPS